METRLRLQGSLTAIPRRDEVMRRKARTDPGVGGTDLLRKGLLHNAFHRLLVGEGGPTHQRLRRNEEPRRISPVCSLLVRPRGPCRRSCREKKLYK